MHWRLGCGAARRGRSWRSAVQGLLYFYCFRHFTCSVHTFTQERETKGVLLLGVYTQLDCAEAAGSEIPGQHDCAEAVGLEAARSAANFFGSLGVVRGQILEA